MATRRTSRRPPPRRRSRGRRWLKFAPKGRNGILAMVAMGLVFMVTLLVGLLLQTFLWWLVTAISALGALAQRRALVLEAEFTREAQARQAHRAGPRPTTGARPGRPGAARDEEDEDEPSGRVIHCTVTGVDIEDCECRLRHVHSARGVETFGRPLGTPYGGKGKGKKGGGGKGKSGKARPKAKPAPERVETPDVPDAAPPARPRRPRPQRPPRERIPTTAHAKPRTAAPGETMRRVL